MSSARPLALPPGLQEALKGGGLDLAQVPVLQVFKGVQEITAFSFRAKRVWMPREHPFWEDGDIQRHLYLQEALTGIAEVKQRPKVSEFCCHVAGCSQLFDTLEGFEHHYNVLHRNVCSFCKRSFPSGHLLDVHILEWHDSLFQILAEKHDMYGCLVEGCQQKFRTSRDRKKHLVKAHQYPPDFRFDKPRKDKRQVKESKDNLAVSMEVTSEEQADMDTSHPEDTDPALCPPCASSRPPLVYKHSIPSTICFGQGAVRGFKNSKKKK